MLTERNWDVIKWEPINWALNVTVTASEYSSGVRRVLYNYRRLTTTFHLTSFHCVRNEHLLCIYLMMWKLGVFDKTDTRAKTMCMQESIPVFILFLKHWWRTITARFEYKVNLNGNSSNTDTCDVWYSREVWHSPDAFSTQDHQRKLERHPERTSTKNSYIN